MKILSRIVHTASVRALKRLEKDENYRFLRESDLFRDLSAEATLLILGRLVERVYCKDEMICKEGNPGICLFLVKGGQIEVYSRKEDGVGRMVYHRYGPGVLFGEVSLVTHSYRTASVRAIEDDTVLLCLSSFDLDYLNSHYPADGLKVLRGITEAISDHLARTSDRLKDVEAEVDALRERLGDA